MKYFILILVTIFWAIPCTFARGVQSGTDHNTTRHKTPPHHTSQDAKTGTAPEVTIHDDAASAKHKNALIKTINDFWNMSQSGDTVSLYELYHPAFKKHVNLTSFLKRKRAMLRHYHIERVSFWGDQCAQAAINLGLRADAIELNLVPVKQQWTLVEGRWLLFEDPFRNRMVPFSMKKKVKPPCPSSFKRDVPIISKKAQDSGKSEKNVAVKPPAAKSTSAKQKYKENQ